MKKILSKTAYTLIELIVSLMLVSIVVMGIFAVNVVLSNNGQDYGQRYLVKSITQTTLSHILNDASLSVGNAALDATAGPNYNTPETGILIGTAGLSNADVNNANSFCFHQDIPSNTLSDTPVNYPATSPPNYAGSRWLCYTYYKAGANSYQILYCAMPYNDNLAYRGAGSCDASNAKITAASQFAGTTYSIFNLNGANNTTPTFTNLTFSITIQNCLNNSLATCSPSGISIDPVNNPEVQLTGSVSTPQESM